MEKENKNFNQDENIKQPSISWLHKRKVTTRVFLVQTFLLGVEYSVFFLTLWLYIKTLVKPENPKVVYSVVSTAYLCSSVILSAIIGKIVDRTRETKKTFLIVNTLVVIGNIMYAFPFSPYYLIFGRLIAGSGGPLKSIIAGELARSYPSEEIVSKFALVGMTFGTGFLIGPTINFAFLKIDFKIYNFHVTVANAAGLYMAVMFLIFNIFVFFFVHDLSKEFDLKAMHEKQENWTKSETNCQTKENEMTPLLPKVTTVKSISVFTSLDSLIILFSSYFMFFLMIVFDMCLPLMVIDILHWTILELNIIVFSSGFLGVMAMLYIAKRPFSEKSLYATFLISIFSLIVLMVIFLIIKMYGASNYISIPLWCIWVTLFTLVAVVEETYLTSTFAKMVPSHMQTFAESIRLGCARCGSITALTTSIYLFDYFTYHTVICSGILLLILFTVIVRRKYLQHPIRI